jgi:hypothetical protein
MKVSSPHTVRFHHKQFVSLQNTPSKCRQTLNKCTTANEAESISSCGGVISSLFIISVLLPVRSMDLVGE